MSTNGSRPIGRVVHHLPGRVRVKLDKRELTPDVLARIEQTLASVPGIHECTANPRTGSLLVRYDADSVDLAELVRLSDAADVVATDARARQAWSDDRDGKPEHWSTWAHAIHTRFAALDRRLRVASGDRFDLKMVMPMAFGVLAIRQVVTQAGSLAPIPWYVLLWYAFDSYMKLHGQSTPGRTAIQTLMEAAERTGATVQATGEGVD